MRDTTPQHDLFTPPTRRQRAEQRRDIGIERSGQHAERIEPDWIDSTVEMIGRYCRIHTGPFLAEDVRSFADVRRHPAPPDGRAWGAAMKRAKSKGMIRSIGFAPANSSNRSPKVLWERT